MIGLTETQRDALDNLSSTELGLIDGITAGTVTASKAVAVDANKDVSAFRNVTVTNLDAGASGTAGTVDIFPTTASKGKASISVTDQTGDTTVSIVVGAMAAARTITLPDPGAAANILTSAGVGGVQLSVPSAQFDATSGTTGTTLTNVAGLTANVLAAGTYAFKAYLSGTATANSGAKFAIGGTATATSIRVTGVHYNNATANAHTTATALSTAVGAATAVLTDATIEGVIVVNAAGTLTVMAAQNASHADTTSVYTTSYFEVKRIA